MSYVFAVLALFSIVSAVWLCANDKDGWGWFVFLAFFMASFATDMQLIDVKL